MRILALAVVTLMAFASSGENGPFVMAKKSSRSAGVSSSRVRASSSSSSRRSGSASRRGSAPVSRRRVVYEDDEDEDDEDQLGFLDNDVDEEDVDEDEVCEEDEDEYDEEEELRPIPSKARRGSSSKPSSRSRGGPPPSSRRPSTKNVAPRKRSGSSRPRYSDDYDDEDYDYDRRSAAGRRRGPPSSRRGPPPGRGSHGSGRGRPSGRRQVVQYNPQPSGAFTSFLAGVRESMPDPSTIRTAAESTFSAAKETTSKISNTVYREVKGLTSSELEQVMLKATRPDDTPVKGKHAERLVGVTYQISGRYDIYDSVLRKLWSKMAEKDWRTTVKALYILHRFSADGAPEHAPALKARLRELRRTKDPKRKDKYFNSKQLLAGDTTPENMKFRAYMARYAHYVMLRAQCFGGMFDEISSDPSQSGKSSKAKKKPQKPITSTALRPEHLDAAKLLLKAGLECSLRDGEECENTALTVERVASDLIGLTAAVAMALNRALKGDDLKGADPALIKKWCEFYSEELLPKTKSMVKKTSTKLDAYGLFLPSRMGTSVSQSILQKGLKAGEEEKAEEAKEVADEEAEEAEVVEEEDVSEKADKEQDDKEENGDEKEEDDGDVETNQAETQEKEDDADDEYDEVYDSEVEEYYDDEEV